MFDFQKLDVYQKAKEFNKDITKTLASKAFDRVTNDQLRRASFSIMLNIAEGSSRFSKKDRRNFLIVSRGSAFECAAILEYLYEINELNQSIFNSYFAFLEEISKMLYSLIKKLDDDINKKERE
jgi:four helix bundle protein